DFVAVLAALKPPPPRCTTKERAFPATETKPARVRRAVLRPNEHYMPSPRTTSHTAGRANHPFCPYCLLTNSSERFRDLVEGDGLVGLRFFVARDSDGLAQDDCGGNGEDWEQGGKALREDAQSGPPAGYEFRKQYVVLQTIGKGA